MHASLETGMEAQGRSMAHSTRVGYVGSMDQFLVFAEMLRFCDAMIDSRLQSWLHSFMLMRVFDGHIKLIVLLLCFTSCHVALYHGVGLGAANMMQLGGLAEYRIALTIFARGHDPLQSLLLRAVVQGLRLKVALIARIVVDLNWLLAGQRP